MTLDELLDREMIRDTLAQYSVSRELGGEIDEAVQAFHEDGILVTSDGQVRRGHLNIMAYLAEITKGRLDAAGPNAYVRHYLYTCRFTFDSATSAKTVTYMLALTENGLDQVVTYNDSLVKENDRWYITHRKIGVEYQIDGSRLKLPTMVVRANIKS